MSGRSPWILLLLVSTSCGGDGVLEPRTPQPPNGAPTLSALQASIFTPRCAVDGCHAPPAPQQGMDLSAGSLYAYTVGVDATELSGFKRIAPGNAADSYLYMKIAADSRIAGIPMPADGTTLSTAEIQAIGAWIDAGAKDD
jgi:hypothetical protein